MEMSLEHISDIKQQYPIATQIYAEACDTIHKFEDDMHEFVVQIFFSDRNHEILYQAIHNEVEKLRDRLFCVFDAWIASMYAKTKDWDDEEKRIFTELKNRKTKGAKQ